MKTLMLFAVVLGSCLSFGQGLVLPPACDPFWKTETGQKYIKTYQDLKQCDARTVKNLRVTWPGVHCVKNEVGKGNHVEFPGQLYDNSEPFKEQAECAARSSR
jgi:hypothetical protein